MLVQTVPFLGKHCADGAAKLISFGSNVSTRDSKKKTWPYSVVLLDCGIRAASIESSIIGHCLFVFGLP
jgi:hypothetical protein